jgi:GNAT superfamily N-acetyltransferase
MDDRDGALVSLRPAVPSVKEGRLFARFLDEAQESWFRAALGPRAFDIIARAYTQPGHELSYLYVTFAERDGRIIGMASGYSAEAHRQFTNQPLQAAAGWRRYRLAIFSRISRRLLRFIDTISDGDFYVRAVAVDQAHRGAGVGTLLMRRLEDRAKALGSKRLALDVAAKNRAARRLYEHLGMIAEAESPKWFGLPNSNVIRMTKLLQSAHRPSEANPS